MADQMERDIERKSIESKKRLKPAGRK